MPVVSNTSPILNLAIVDHLNFLQQQFVEVIIPAEVLAELLPMGENRGVPAIRQAIDAAWLRVAELPTAHVSRVLALELDRGEAAAIALAVAIQALRAEAGFFVTDDLVAEILEEAGELKRK